MPVAGAHIPVGDTRAMADGAPVEAEFVVFDGVPHLLLDRSLAEHAAEP